MNLKHLIILTAACQGFATWAFICAATGGTYLVGEVGLVGLGGAILMALIPYALMNIFEFKGE